MQDRGKIFLVRPEYDRNKPLEDWVRPFEEFAYAKLKALGFSSTLFVSFNRKAPFHSDNDIRIILSNFTMLTVNATDQLEVYYSGLVDKKKCVVVTQNPLVMAEAELLNLPCIRPPETNTIEAAKVFFEKMTNRFSFVNPLNDIRDKLDEKTSDAVKKIFELGNPIKQRRGLEDEVTYTLFSDYYRKLYDKTHYPYYYVKHLDNEKKLNQLYINQEQKITIDWIYKKLLADTLPDDYLKKFAGAPNHKEELLEYIKKLNLDDSKLLSLWEKILFNKDSQLSRFFYQPRGRDEPRTERGKLAEILEDALIIELRTTGTLSQDLSSEYTKFDNGKEKVYKAIKEMEDINLRISLWSSIINGNETRSTMLASFFRTQRGSDPTELNSGMLKKIGKRLLKDKKTLEKQTPKSKTSPALVGMFRNKIEAFEVETKEPNQADIYNQLCESSLPQSDFNRLAKKSGKENLFEYIKSNFPASERLRIWDIIIKTRSETEIEEHKAKGKEVGPQPQLGSFFWKANGPHASDLNSGTLKQIVEQYKKDQKELAPKVKDQPKILTDASDSTFFPDPQGIQLDPIPKNTLRTPPTLKKGDRGGFH